MEVVERLEKKEGCSSKMRYYITKADTVATQQDLIKVSQQVCTSLTSIALGSPIFPCYLHKPVPVRFIPHGNSLRSRFEPLRVPLTKVFPIFHPDYYAIGSAHSPHARI